MVHVILHVSQSGILEGSWCSKSSAGNRIATEMVSSWPPSRRCEEISSL